MNERSASMWRALGTAGLILACGADARAQVRIGAGSGPRPGSVELIGGIMWAQGFDLASAPAELTRNPTTGSSPLVLFNSETRIDPAAGAQVRLGVYLTPRVSIEGGVQYSRPVLATRVSGDFEGADSATLSETLTRYVFDGAVVLHLPAFASGRGVPFVMGGAGYLRELHEGNGLVETGAQYYAGGGVKIWFGEARRRFGIRGDVGVSIRDGGFDFEEGQRMLPTVSTALVYLF